MIDGEEGIVDVPSPEESNKLAEERQLRNQIKKKRQIKLGILSFIIFFVVFVRFFIYSSDSIESKGDSVGVDPGLSVIHESANSIYNGTKDAEIKGLQQVADSNRVKEARDLGVSSLSPIQKSEDSVSPFVPKDRTCEKMDCLCGFDPDLMEKIKSLSEEQLLSLERILNGDMVTVLSGLSPEEIEALSKTVKLGTISSLASLEDEDFRAIANFVKRKADSRVYSNEPLNVKGILAFSESPENVKVIGLLGGLSDLDRSKIFSLLSSKTSDEIARLIALGDQQIKFQRERDIDIMIAKQRMAYERSIEQMGEVDYFKKASHQVLTAYQKKEEKNSSNKGKEDAVQKDFANSKVDNSTGDKAKSSPRIMFGSIIPATLDYAISSDSIIPIRATISSGPLKGAVAIGSFSSTDESLNLVFTKITKNGKSAEVNVVAINPNGSGAEFASDVDHHYIARAASVAGAAFLAGVASDIVQPKTNVVINQGVSSTTTDTPKSVNHAIWSGVNEITKEAQKLAKESSQGILNTVTLSRLTKIGLMFVDSATDEWLPQIRPDRQR